MEETILVTASLAAGAAAGALLAYARDRNLLRLYGQLVADLSRIVRNLEGGPPEPPASAAGIPQPNRAADLMAKRAS